MARTPTLAASPTVTASITLDGGVDLVTPLLLAQPGVLRVDKNFEVSWNRGYTRVAGYERYDGHPMKPSAAVPTYLSVVSFENTPTVGQTLTGQTSSATGIIARLDTNMLVLANVSGGPFSTSEVVKVGATTIGTTTGPVSRTAKQEAQGAAATADYYRTFIAAVPGSGPVRGIVTAIFSGSDETYAFRNNAGGTAKDIYKATATGWVQVALYNEVSFTAGGTGVPADGQTLTEGAVTATIKRVVLESGSWAGSDAAGRFIVEDPSGGDFSAGAATAGSVGVTLSGIQTAITLPAGGKYVFHLFNFIGSTQDQRIYGADGVGRAIEFDGDVVVPIVTGATPDTPSVVIEHNNYLFLGIGASMFYSGPGLPYTFSAGLGAGEIAVGDAITNFNRQPASQASPSLGVYATNSTQFLTGAGPSEWVLTPFKNGVGAYAFSTQTLDHAYVFDRNGLIDYRAAESFGNYVQAAVTVLLQPFTNQVRNNVSCSVVDRSKSQYRIFFGDGSGIFTTIVNGRVRGSGLVQYAHTPNVAWESILSDGSPIALFGSNDDGMVYEMERGTSFDGVEIDANCVLNWFQGNNPRIRKRWQRAFIEVESAGGLIEFTFGRNLAYGDTAKAPQPLDITTSTESSGAPVWDTFVWDEASWDGASPLSPLIQLSGTSTNIQFAFSTAVDYLQPFTISTILVDYLNRRIER